MDEEKKDEGKEVQEATPDKPAATVENNEDGNATEEKGSSMIDGAVLAAEELKKQNDRKEKLINREEELATKKVFGGVTEAGKAAEPVVETNADYANKVMSNDL